MQNRKSALESIRPTLCGSLFLGLVLAVLSAGQAGAVSDDEDRLFRFAAHDKDNGTVRQLLAEGISPNVPVGFIGRTAVHNAAKGGAAKNLAVMLKADGNPNAQDRDGNTPLHFASMGSFSGGFSDYPGAIRALLQYGADLRQTNNGGETPLHVAVFSGVSAAHVDVVKALLDAGAKPQRVDENGLTALQRFARQSVNNGAIVTLLLEAGADPDRKDPGGDVPLHAAIKTGGSYGKAEVVEALLDGGANPCVRDARGYTPYHMSSDMKRIHQALSRAGGSDASHAGAEGCKMGSDDAPKLTDKGDKGLQDEENTRESVATLDPLCANADEGIECWKVVSDKPGCYVFTGYFIHDQTYTWSGDCVDSKVSGEGRGVWHSSKGEFVYEGNMRDGKQHGRGTTRYSDGSVVEGSYVDGKRHGHWVRRSGDGPLLYEGPYVDGKKHGHWVERSSYGAKEGPYVDGKRHGHWVTRSGDGKQHGEGPYVDGKKHGHWVTRHSGGGGEEGPFVDGKKHGHWVTRRSGGGGEEGPFVDGKKHGHWVTRSGDGKQHGEGPYVDGREHGRWIVTMNGFRHVFEYERGLIVSHRVLQ